jgi:hypothetical protein
MASPIELFIRRLSEIQGMVVDGEILDQNALPMHF